MAKGKITEIVDIERTQAQIDTLVGQLEKGRAKFEEILKIILEMNREFKDAKGFVELNRILKENKKVTEEAGKAAKQAADQEAELEKKRQKLAEQTDEYLKKQAELKIQTAERQKQAKQQAILDKEEATSLNARSIRLGQLKDQYRAMSEAKRETAEGKEMLQAIQKEDGALKKANAALGDHQRNVGNYQSALEGLPGPIGNAVSSISQMGKALWALVANPIGAVIAALVGGVMLLYKAFTATDAGGEKIEGLFKSISNITKVIFQRIESLRKALVDLFTFDWEGFKSNSSAAFSGLGSAINQAANAGKKYVDQMAVLEDVIGANVLSIAKIEDKIIELERIRDDATKSTKERLNAAKEIEMKEMEILKMKQSEAKRLFEIERDNLAETMQIQGASVEAKKLLLGQILNMNAEQILSEQQKGSLIGQMYDLEGDAIINLQKLAADEVNAKKNFKEETKKNFRKYKQFEKDLNDQEIKEKEDRQKADADTLKKTIEEQKKAFRQEKELAELSAGVYEEMSEDERAAYSDRLQALEEFSKVKLQANDAAMMEELLGVEEGSTEYMAILQKYQAIAEQITRDGSKKRLEIQQAEQDAINQAVIDGIEKRSAEELTLLNEKLRAGLIDQKTYEDQRAALIAGASQDVMQEQISIMEAELASFSGTAQEKARIEMELAKLRQELSDAVLETELSNEEKSKQATLEKWQSIHGMASDVMGAISDLYAAGYDAQKAKIEGELDDLEYQKEKELEMAGDNEQMKEQIEARFQAKKEQIDARSRQLDIQKAKFDKAAAIAKIAMDTAVGMVQLWVKPGGLAGIALMAVLGAIGAAQMAAVAARPLPRYRHGTKAHPGGLAWVGEGGEELLRFPSGDTMLTPARESLMNLPKGTEVITHEEVSKAIRGEQMNLRRSASVDSGQGWQSVAAEIREVKRAIHNRPEYRTVITDRRIRNYIVNANSVTEYLNRAKE